MTCPRCAGLIFEIHETLETHATLIHVCANCGWRLYPTYEPSPMREVTMLRGRPRKRMG